LDALLNIHDIGKLTTQTDMTDGMISMFSLSTSHLHLATSHYHLHIMAYISLNWFIMQGSALHAISLWVGVDHWQTSWCYREFYSLVWCQHFASSMAVTII
jgi:hypothetical protein